MPPPSIIIDMSSKIKHKIAKTGAKINFSTFCTKKALSFCVICTYCYIAIKGGYIMNTYRNIEGAFSGDLGQVLGARGALLCLYILPSIFPPL